MPYKFRRICPICFKADLLYLADHLRQVHHLSCEERQPWLKSAVFSPTPSSWLPSVPPYPFWGMRPYTRNQPLLIKQRQSNILSQRTTAKVKPVNCLEPPTCIEQSEITPATTEVQPKRRVKRKAENDNGSLKKFKKQSKPRQTKPHTRKRRRLAVYQPEFNEEEKEKE